jgi:aminomethyltransferase
VTSGAPSPTLGVPIAMAYLEPEAARLAQEAAAGGAGGASDGASRLAVDVRGRAEPARAVPLPFYRRPA